jgi:hypothetical protein
MPQDEKEEEVIPDSGSVIRYTIPVPSGDLFPFTGPAGKMVPGSS